jgi:hypothetical protein
LVSKRDAKAAIAVAATARRRERDNSHRLEQSTRRRESVMDRTARGSPLPVTGLAAGQDHQEQQSRLSLLG